MWGHPHTAQLLPLLRSPLSIRATFTLAPAISVSPPKWPFRSSSKRDQVTRPRLPTLPTRQWQKSQNGSTRIKGGLSEPQSQSEGVLCHTPTMKKQPSNTSARKQRQTARRRCLVDRGTPLLSRADNSSSSFRSGISTSRNP